MQSTDNASFCKVKLVPFHLIFLADEKLFCVNSFRAEISSKVKWWCDNHQHCKVLCKSQEFLQIYKSPDKNILRCLLFSELFVHKFSDRLVILAQYCAEFYKILQSTVSRGSFIWPHHIYVELGIKSNTISSALLLAPFVNHKEFYAQFSYLTTQKAANLNKMWIVNDFPSFLLVSYLWGSLGGCNVWVSDIRWLENIKDFKSFKIFLKSNFVSK